MEQLHLGEPMPGWTEVGLHGVDGVECGPSPAVADGVDVQAGAGGLELPQGALEAAGAGAGQAVVGPKVGLS